MHFFSEKCIAVITKYSAAAVAMNINNHKRGNICGIKEYSLNDFSLTN